MVTAHSFLAQLALLASLITVVEWQCCRSLTLTKQRKQYLDFSFFYSFLQCFYIPKCRKNYAALHVIVRNISERLRSQHTVQCFVDPTDRMDSAILTPIYDRVAVFHSLFWPTCTLIGGTIIIAMVKLTQYLSIMCERLSRIKR